MQTVQNSDKTAVRIVIGLASALILLLCCAVIVVVAWINRDSLTAQFFPTEILPTQTLIPTRTATLTPQPHILVHEPPDGAEVLEEYFEANSRQWVSYYYRPSKVQDGMLKLWSSLPGYVNTVWCKGCDIYTHKYYFQADVKMEKFSRISYGLAFSINDNNNYYIFLINHNNFTYHLIKSVNDEWVVLLDETPYDALRGHPNSNTLSVFFDEGNIQLYINGNMVDGYIDSDPFLSGRLGFIVEDARDAMLVDNVFAYALR